MEHELNGQTQKSAVVGVAMVCAIFLLANASMGAMPVLFGGYVDHLGFSLKVAGRVASAETCGLALGSVLYATVFARRGGQLKPIVLASLAFLLAAQLFSAWTRDPLQFGAIRALSGLCVGTIQSVGAAWIATVRFQGRAFALYVGMSFLSGALGMPAFSWALGSGGITALFLGYALVIVLAFALALRFPAYDPPAAAKARETEPDHGGFRRIALLFALALNFALNGGVWVYLERAGGHAGISAAAISGLLSAGMFVALGTTLAIAFVADRGGRMAVIVLAHAMLAASTFMLVFDRGVGWYAGAVILFHIALAVVSPYLLAALALADRSGRIMLRGVAAINVGYSVAPLLFTTMVVSLGAGSALAVSAAVFILCLALTLWGLAAPRTISR